MQEEENTEIEQEIDTEEQQENAQTVDTTDWKSEALKYKAIADRHRKKSTQPITNPKQGLDDETVSTVKRLALLEEKRQFGFENQLSPEETDFVFKISQGKPAKEILEDPFVKAGLDGYRSSKRLEANTPGSSSRSAVFNEKPFTELSEEDRKKTFETKMKNFKK